MTNGNDTHFLLIFHQTLVSKFLTSGGFLAEKYGGKWFLWFGTLVTSVFTLLTPPAAKLGTTALIAVRIIEGLGEVII